MVFQSYEIISVDNLGAASAFQNLVYGLENLKRERCLSEGQENAFYEVRFMIEKEDSREVYFNYLDVMGKVVDYSYEIEARILNVLKGRDIKGIYEEDMDCCIRGFKNLASIYWLKAQGF